MITVRTSEERGHFNHGWLDTYHTFSFGEFYDPEFTSFRSLRVINDDRVAPGHGFPMHPHHDMEIITYLLEGELQHKDSLGHGAVLKTGEVQRITAGKGILHSESNPSKTAPVHLLQIWITPRARALPPSYDQRPFPEATRRNRLKLVCSPDGADGSITINQDVRLYASLLDTGQRLEHTLDPGRAAWVQIARGAMSINGITLNAGDGAAITDEAMLALSGAENSEFLLFDLA